MMEDMEKSLGFLLEAIERFEYLIAKREYHKLLDLTEKNNEEGKKFFQQQVQPHQKEIEKMLQKSKEIERAFEAVEDNREDWTIGSSSKGMTTRYFVDDSGCINLKVEGELENLPLYEQLVVIWEVALYHLWVPYCSESRVLKSFDNSEFITTMTLNPPFGITRDIIVHAFGANCLTEQNSIVLVTKSLTDSAHDKELTEGTTIPPINKGFFFDRVHLHHLYCVNTMTSPTSTKFAAVMKLDPKLSFGLPDSILSWFINQLASVVLPLLRKQAVYLAEADPYDSAYTNQIRASSAFYVDFLLPIYRDYVQRQGWGQPCIRCLYQKGIPKADYDYRIAPTLKGHDESSELDNKMTIHLPAKNKQLSKSNTSSPRKGSVASSDFYSCLGDQDRVPDRKFCSEEWRTLSREDKRRAVIASAEYEEPFLEDNICLLDDSADKYRMKSEDGDLLEKSSRDVNCCRRLFCCCYGF